MIFTTNFAFTQSIDSIIIDTTLTDLELSFQDSVAALNEENELFSSSRKAYNVALALLNNQNFQEAIVNFNNAIVIDSGIWY